MNNKKLLYSIILIIVFVGFLSCEIWAIDIQNTTDSIQNRLQTNDVNELQNLHNEVQNYVQDANNQLVDVQTGLSETMMQIQNLDEKINQYQTEIDSISAQSNGLKESIDKLEQELAIAQQNYDEKKQILETRLVVLYEAGQTAYLDVLLNSKSLTDFISRYYFITEIANYDENLLEEAELEKTRIEVAKNTLNEQKEKYKVAKDNTEKTAILLENTKVVKNNYINLLSDEEKKLQQQIDTYNQQIREIESEIVTLTTANIGADYVGGGFLWPVPGYSRISSPFGTRVHPITGVTKLHTGTDVPAPKGTHFLAMNSGLVVKASYNAAYGNMVIINHGGGVATLYAHGDNILVQVGQYVNKGDPVLEVGTTGYSTGPHAHFEIRINGQYVDPMNYVKPE